MIANRFLVKGMNYLQSRLKITPQTLIFLVKPKARSSTPLLEQFECLVDCVC